MGYFANGTEGDLFREAFCFRCVNWRDLDDGRGPGCPIMDAHFIFAYDLCNEDPETHAGKGILEMLITQREVKTKDGYAALVNECAMFVPTDPSFNPDQLTLA